MTIAYRVLGCICLALIFAAGVPLMAVVPMNARLLSNFTNADGHAPDGKDTKQDDTAAIKQALAAGPGIVYIGSGFYRWGDVTIPSGVTVAGSGAGTIIRSNGAKQIFLQQSMHEWVLRDLLLDGEATGKWEERKDLGRSGILVERCWGYEISGVTVRNFNGAGLRMTRTDLPAAGWSNGGTLDRISATGNVIGIHFDLRAEYINATKLSCANNVTGCLINAGNAKVVASNFGANTDGIVVEDKENGSHGIIADCMVNHNARYALLAKGVQNGMNVTGCCFFYGTVQLENSTGVNISGGSLSCHLNTMGPGANRISGNYLIPLDFTIKLAPSTLIDGNCTAKGSWEKNMK